MSALTSPVRTRFAPSPTGPLHIGGLRTALFAYCFARRYGGRFILRIEDTDQKRLVPGSEAYIQNALQWLGITPDEGPVQGGNYGPYRQSERKALYQRFVQQLLDGGHAYYAFDTPEALDAMRARLQAAKIAAPQYNALSRTAMKNSLTLPADEVRGRLERGEPYVVRLKVAHREEVRFHDTVRGWVKVSTDTLDDKVLLKADGLPTYHLANVVDDHLMQITHVIRGEEWLPSTPTHQLLYQALGWEPPQFAHLPLLLKPEGQGKLSKRDGDKHGFPVFPLTWVDPTTNEQAMGFRETGYLPQALINFLALLGWNPGNDVELLSLRELEAQFSLNRVSKAGVKFDLPKLQWFNQHYLRALSQKDLMQYLRKAAPPEGIRLLDRLPVGQVAAVLELVKERAVVPQDLWTEAAPYFVAPHSYDAVVLAKKWDSNLLPVLRAVQKALYLLEPFTDVAIKKTLSKVCEDYPGVKLGQVMPLVRVALLGSSKGADLTQVLAVLGKEISVQRLMAFLEAQQAR